MAKRTITQLIDDIDSTEAAKTIRFSIDDKRYEIDLNEQHAREFTDALKPYVRAARSRYAPGRKPGPKSTRAT